MLGAATVLALLVVPIALAGSSSSSGGPKATASASVKKQLRQLKRQVKLLQQQVGKLAAQAGPQGAQGPQGPPGSDAQFNGAAAGGVLTGTYPNPLLAMSSVGEPEIAGGAVTSAEILNGAVLTQDIGDGAVGSVDIASGAVGSSKLATIHDHYGNLVQPDGGTGENGNWGTATSTAFCEAGEQLITGYGQWTDNAFNEELATGDIDLFRGSLQVNATGLNDSGNNTRNFRAVAVCIG